MTYDYLSAGERAEANSLRQRALEIAMSRGIAGDFRAEWDRVGQVIQVSTKIAQSTNSRYVRHSVMTRARIAFLQAIVDGKTPLEARTVAYSTEGVKEWLS